MTSEALIPVLPLPISIRIRNIGITIFKEALSIFLDKDTTVVSVGSGTGFIEALVFDKCYCIDPFDPISETTNFYIPLMIKRDYKYCNECLLDHPELVNNCLLFLNSASNGILSYDLDSVLMFNPKKIMVIISQENKVGGSIAFKEWFKSSNNYKKIYEKKSERNFYTMNLKDICAVLEREN